LPTAQQVDAVGHETATRRLRPSGYFCRIDHEPDAFFAAMAGVAPKATDARPTVRTVAAARMGR
jgi:hypothetical protein